MKHEPAGVPHELLIAAREFVYFLKQHNLRPDNYKLVIRCANHEAQYQLEMAIKRDSSAFLPSLTKFTIEGIEFHVIT